MGRLPRLLLLLRLPLASNTHRTPFTMTVAIAETQLLNALRHAENVRRMMSPADPAQWRDYVESMRAVSLANWSASTDLHMRFALLRTVLNEIR